MRLTLFTRSAISDESIVTLHSEYFRLTKCSNYKYVVSTRMHQVNAVLQHLGGSDWYSQRLLTGRNIVVDVIKVG